MISTFLATKSRHLLSRTASASSTDLSPDGETPGSLTLLALLTGSACLPAVATFRAASHWATELLPTELCQQGTADQPAPSQHEAWGERQNSMLLVPTGRKASFLASPLLGHRHTRPFPPPSGRAVPGKPIILAAQIARKAAGCSSLPHRYSLAGAWLAACRACTPRQGLPRSKTPVGPCGT